MEIGYEMERTKQKKQHLEFMMSELRVSIERKQAIMKNLEDQIAEIRSEEQAKGECECGAENKLSVFMKDVCVVIGAVASDEFFMKTKYTTQSSQMYYKIEKEVFEDYISRYSGLPLKDFIEFCKRLSFIKVENNKCIFPSGRARVYFLMKGIVDELRE